MAKIDDVINRLERLTNDVNQVKLSLIGLLPIPPVAKPVVRRGVEGLDPILTELYFDALRGGVDLATDSRVQESSIRQFKAQQCQDLVLQHRKETTKCRVLRSKWQMKDSELNLELFVKV